jgi:hypothetical protein
MDWKMKVDAPEFIPGVEWLGLSIVPSGSLVYSYSYTCKRD